MKFHLPWIKPQVRLWGTAEPTRLWPEPALGGDNQCREVQQDLMAPKSGVVEMCSSCSIAAPQQAPRNSLCKEMPWVRSYLLSSHAFPPQTSYTEEPADASLHATLRTTFCPVPTAQCLPLSSPSAAPTSQVTLGSWVGVKQHLQYSCNSSPAPPPHPSPHLSTLRPHSWTAVEASPRHTVGLCWNSCFSAKGSSTQRPTSIEGCEWVVPQTSIKAETPSLHSKMLARSFTFQHHILPNTPSQAHSPHIYCSS